MQNLTGTTFKTVRYNYYNILPPHTTTTTTITIYYYYYYYCYYYYLKPIPLAAQSQVLICGRSVAEIEGSTPAVGHGCLSYVSVM
jgi:hypothetical protein